MSFFRKFFGKNSSGDILVRVRAIMEKFIEVSLVTVPVERDPDQGKIILVYMFGALDFLCQWKEVDEKTTLTFFKELLKNELGDYTCEQAEIILREVVKVSAEAEGQLLMKEGAETLKAWLADTEPGAPFRLTEILISKGK